MRWKIGDRPPYMADYECFDLPRAKAAEIVSILLVGLPVLNDARRSAVGS